MIIDACIKWFEVIEAFEKRRLKIALLCIMQLVNKNRSIERLVARNQIAVIEICRQRFYAVIHKDIPAGSINT